jgi:hypothetical protein
MQHMIVATRLACCVMAADAISHSRCSVAPLCIPTRSSDDAPAHDGFSSVGVETISNQSLGRQVQFWRV